MWETDVLEEEASPSQNGKLAQYPSLVDRRVIISGGASGIGAGLVEAFAAQGAAVGFVDLMEEESMSMVDALGKTRHAPLFLRCDVTDCDDYGEKIGKLVDKLGGCDVLINNAASDDRHAVEDVTPEYWDKRIAVNLKHQFFAARAVIAPMVATGGGSIINLGSISWHLGLPQLSIYQIAKAGIEGLTRSLARELGGRNIRVNTIIPGNVQTPRQQIWYSPEEEAAIVDAQCLKGRVQPRDVAALALFLAADDSRYCTGHEYWVDGGWR